MARVTPYLMQTAACNGPPWLLNVPDGSVPLLLVRHGQTAWNKERRFLGRSDIPLDEEGQAQAASVAEALATVELSAVYTSHLKRAAATADAICAQRGLDATRIPDLQELDQGKLEGMSGSDLHAAYPDFLEAWISDPADTRVPGGETLRECQVRVLSATRAIMEAHAPGPPVAIVTHRMVLSCIICEALGLPLRMWRLIGQRNTAVNLLSWSEGRFCVHRLNDTTHLGVVEVPPPMPA